MLVADNYFWLMALVAMGSTFPPLGIRLAYTLGKITMSFRFLLHILLTLNTKANLMHIPKCNLCKFGFVHFSG